MGNTCTPAGFKKRKKRKIKTLSALTTGFLKSYFITNRDLLINEGWDLLQPFYVIYREIGAHELNYTLSAAKQSLSDLLAHLPPHPLPPPLPPPPHPRPPGVGTQVRAL